MAKRNLYEILGIAPTASQEEILRAYHAAKLASQNAQDEEGRNHLAFLEYAREHLTNPQKRTRYDATLQEAVDAISILDGPALSSPVEKTTSTSLLRLALLTALAGGALYVWKHSREPAPATQTANPQQITQAPAPTTEKNEVGDGLVFEPTPSSQAGPAASGTSEPATPTAPAIPKRTYQVETTAVDAELVKKLVWSVYAIVGSRGFGTGVMVDSERLLTNCHVIAGNARAGKMYAVNAITHDKAEITEVAYLDHQDACLIRAPGLTGQPVGINHFAQMTSEFKTHNIGFARGNLMSSEGRFLGWAYRFGQKFLVSNNYCDHGVSGGPLVDDEGRLVGLTTGGPADKSYCLSVTTDTISALKYETSRPISEFPENYTSNVSRRS